jgi:hypothetical protein
MRGVDGLETMGPYRVTGKIGRGGMGAVYRARHESLGREVALKVLVDQSAADDPNVLERFRREAEAACAISHPGLVKVFDFGQERGVWYLAMELVTGRTLMNVLEERGQLPVAECLRLTREMFDALGACHRAKLWHRDLKPSNLMLDDGGRLRVLDLGLVKRIDRTVLTEEGFRVGSPRYMPPEMVSEATSDARSDIYQMGLIAYEMFAGTPAFPENDVPKLLGQIITEDPPPLPQRSGVGGDRLVALIARCIEKAPDARFATCEDALAFLDAKEPAAARTPSRPLEDGVRGPAGSLARRSASISASASGSRADGPGAARVAVAAVLVAAAIGGVALAMGAFRTRGDEGGEVAVVPSPSASEPAPALATPAAPPSPRSIVELVEHVALKRATGLRRQVFDDLREDRNKVGEQRVEAARRWRTRMATLLEPELLVPVLEELAREQHRVLAPEVPLELRGLLLRKLADLTDIEAMLRDTVGLAAGLPLKALADGPLSPSAQAPAGTRRVLAVQFADGGFAEKRVPLGGAKLIGVDGTARFEAGQKAFLTGSYIQGRKDWKGVDLETLAAPPQAAWLHYRVSSGATGERLCVRINMPGLRRGADIAFLRADGEVRERWMQIDPRVLGAGRLTMRVDFEERTQRLVKQGIVLDYLEFLVR